MYTTITLISLLSYIGTITSTINGTLTAKKMKLHYSLQFLSGIFSAFLGEIIVRYFILLQAVPTTFQASSEVFIAVLICILSIIILKYQEPRQISLSALCLLDSIGMVGSVIIGYNQGINISIPTALICSFVTAIGSTLLSTIVKMAMQKNLKTAFHILVEDKKDYLFASSITTIYAILHFTNHATNTTIMALAALSVTLRILIEEKDHTHQSSNLSS